MRSYKDADITRNDIRLDVIASWDEEDYVGGSATIIEKKDDKYITIKFDSFTFESHTLNGTVQLSFDED